nr:unnamed protein product [Callosobruchus chinensis]
MSGMQYYDLNPKLSDAICQTVSDLMLVLFLESPLMYNCPQCCKIYKHANNLNRHLRYECGKTPQFSCSLCPKAYTQKSSLKSHYFKHHHSFMVSENTLIPIDRARLELLPYSKKLLNLWLTCLSRGRRSNPLFSGINFNNNQCPVCERIFTRKDHVQRHYLEQHMKPKEYECKRCQKKFKRRYLMENHNRNCNVKKQLVDLAPEGRFEKTAETKLFIFPLELFEIILYNMFKNTYLTFFLRKISVLFV